VDERGHRAIEHERPPRGARTQRLDGHGACDLTGAGAIGSRGRGGTRGVRRAAQTPPRGLSGGSLLQSDIESVRIMHAMSVIVHIFGNLALDEGHNIANCSNRRA
jgi:hypothetical protein